MKCTPHIKDVDIESEPSSSPTANVLLYMDMDEKIVHSL